MGILAHLNLFRGKSFEIRVGKERLLFSINPWGGKVSGFTASLVADEMNALSARLKDVCEGIKAIPFPSTPSQAQLGFADVVEAAESFFSCAKERAEEVGQWVEKGAQAVISTCREFEETDEKLKGEFRKVADTIFSSADRED